MPPRPDHHRPPTAATPIAFVEAVLRAYAKYGADPSWALQQAQIAPSLLQKPQARVTARQFEALCSAAMQQLDDEALGWFTRRLPWGSYGLLCRASTASPNLGVALKRWCRHHRLLVDDIELSFASDGTAATVAIEEKRDLGAFREFALLTSLRYLHGYACWAVDSRITLREARFPFAAPPHAAVYALLFPGPVSFGAPRAALVFDAHYLALPIVRDEPALRTMLQHALPLTVRQYRRDRLLVQRVRELLRRRGGESATAAMIADALNVSLRTLHRQLRGEGATLQALKDEARHERAAELLQRSRRGIKQIAHEVGFRSEKSFARAFRSWSGHPPSEWRARTSASPAAPQSAKIHARTTSREGEVDA